MEAAQPRRGRPPKQRPVVEPPAEAARLEHQQKLGKRLREQRELRGWTPGDLAHRAGLTAAGVRILESGQRAPLTWTVKVLADALGCPAGWLAFGG